jgi:hypothetical protein
VSQGRYELIRELATPLTLFILGIIAAPITHGLSYLSNLNFARAIQLEIGIQNIANRELARRSGLKATLCRRAALTFTLASIVCFLIGSCTAYRTFSSVGPSKANPATIHD